MIFAELEYEYSEFHEELVTFIKSEFHNVEYGLQGDSRIWVFENNEKITVDTFSSMKHQVKSSSADFSLVNKDLEHISSKYNIVIYDTPELEGHE